MRQLTKKGLAIAGVGTFALLLLLSYLLLLHFSQPVEILPFDNASPGTSSSLSENVDAGPDVGQTLLTLHLPTSRQMCEPNEPVAQLPDLQLEVRLSDQGAQRRYVQWQIVDGRLMSSFEPTQEPVAHEGVGVDLACSCEPSQPSNTSDIQCTITGFNESSVEKVQLTATMRWAEDWKLDATPALHLEHRDYNTAIWTNWLAFVCGLLGLLMVSLILYLWE